MLDYWIGVLVGFWVALMFFICCLMCFQYRFNKMKTDFKELKTEHESICKWINENETVMKTYEFFNKNIVELLEEKSKNE